jgi:hypothetical protein
LDLSFAINQISNNYVAIAGLGLDTYLFTLCSLDKLDVSYSPSFSLNGEVSKQEYSIDLTQKAKLKQRQANLLLLQIISGLEVALMHRGGIVAEQDYPKEAESLEISYRKLTFSLQGTETGKSYNLQEMIANKTPTPEPWNPVASPEIIRAAKEFKIGDQINFEDQDLNSIYVTFQMFTVVLQSRITTIITTLNTNITTLNFIQNYCNQ